MSPHLDRISVFALSSHFLNPCFSASFDVETAFSTLYRDVVMLHPRNGCCRRTLVEILDELLDLIGCTLGFASYLCKPVNAGRIIRRSILTVPSEAFVTKPVTPIFLACLCVDDLDTLLFVAYIMRESSD